MKMIALFVFIAFTSQAMTIVIPPKSVKADNDCCMCGPEITVTMIAENTLTEPFFNLSVELTTQQRELIYMMKKAVDVDNGFKFMVTYWGESLGYYIESINGVVADSNKNMYWGILDQKGFTSGVSSYVPDDGAVILFNLTQGS